MEKQKIRIGIIGVDAERGWASSAHIPAIRQFPEFEITAVSNRSKAKALAAAKKFNIPNAFDNVEDLVQSPDVDLVVVSVKVPHHKELVTAVLQAEKHVYCEWPLGNGLKESIEMERLSKTKNVQAFIGLQSQAVPAINYIRDLIKDGYVGKILSSSIVASGMMLQTDEANAYTFDNKNGANMLTIPFGATMHAVSYCIGEYIALTATTATVHKDGVIMETGRKIPITFADQIAVSGILKNGAVSSIHYRGGTTKGTNFLGEINGTDGDLLINADAGHVAFFPLNIQGAKKNQEKLETLIVPKKYNWVNEHELNNAVFNVAQNYYLVLNDLQKDTHLAARFSDAVIRHKMLDSIEQSSLEGKRLSYL